MFNQRGREACESGFQDHAFAALLSGPARDLIVVKHPVCHCRLYQQSLYSSNQLFCISILHKCEPKPFLAEVFDGCADQIDVVIDYQEPVVCL